MKVKSRIVTGVNGKLIRPGDVVDMDEKKAKIWVKENWGDAIDTRTKSKGKV